MSPEDSSQDRTVKDLAKETKLLGFGRDGSIYPQDCRLAVHRGVVDGLALCRMFNRAIHTQALPKYLSSDHDPLYLFHQWQANLRVLDLQEIKTVPYVPLSHPFVERQNGTFVVLNKSPD